jgi:hypothetical protein
VIVSLGVVMVALASSNIAKADYVQSWVDSRGGCKRAWTDLGRIYGDKFLGKPNSEWTDAMVEEYAQVRDRCFLEVNGFPPSYNLDARREVQRATQTLKQAVERGRAAERQRLAQIEASGRLARETMERERAKQNEMAALEALEAQKKRELSQEEARIKQERLRAEAKRNREAAEEALRVAEAEAPKIAEAAKEAEEARRARQAAEQKLADIRSQLGLQEKARQDALARAEAAEISRRQELQREVDPAKHELAAVTTPAKAEISQALNAMPDLEKQFIAAVENARSVYKSGANDMAKGAARPLRAKELCALLRSPSIRNWVGRVSKLSTNGDGKGVLEVQIDKDIVIKTWNNAVSDAGDNTLIDPGSPLFSKASALAEGKQVVFSGSFRADSTDCVREGSLTLRGSLMEPEFIFRFSDVASKQ